MLLNVTGSSFVNNSAYLSAGVMLVQSTNLIVNDCLFTGNTALTGSAGVMDLSCPITPGIGNCTYSISNSVFSNNSAGVNGGAITYDFFPPDVSANNTFENNSATYAPDVGSYPATIVMPQGRRLQALSATEVEAMGLSNAVVYYIDVPQVSGNVINPSVTLDLLGIAGVKIVTDNSSVATMVPLDSNSVNLLKSKFVTVVEGTFVFNDVIIVSNPGTNVTIKIQVDSIDKAKLAAAFPGASFADVYLLFSLRLCTRGEYQTSDNKCVVCAQGLYSLYENQSACHSCPAEA